MLARARKAIKRTDFSQRKAPRSLRNSKLTLRLVHQISRASVTQRLDLIRIRLLRSQLAELYKIKDLLEKRMIEQHELEKKQRAEHELERQRRQRVLEDEEEQVKQRLDELERLRLAHLEERERQREARQDGYNESSFVEDQKEDEEQLPRSAAKAKLDTTITLLKSRPAPHDDDENTPPPDFYTPEEDKNTKDSRYSTIQEEDDDLVPPMVSTPPRSHARQSIGQWSVERAKNNMSVRSLVSSLEVKVGPKSGHRTRVPK